MLKIHLVLRSEHEVGYLAFFQVGTFTVCNFSVVFSYTRTFGDYGEDILDKY